METVLRKVDIQKENRLPKENGEYSKSCLILTKFGSQYYGYYDFREKLWRFDNDDFDSEINGVTHWYEEVSLSELTPEAKDPYLKSGFDCLKTQCPVCSAPAYTNGEQFHFIDKGVEEDIPKTIDDGIEKMADSIVRSFYPKLTPGDMGLALLRAVRKLKEKGLLKKMNK